MKRKEDYTEYGLPGTEYTIRQYPKRIAWLCGEYDGKARLIQTEHSDALYLDPGGVYDYKPKRKREKRNKGQLALMGASEGLPPWDLTRWVVYSWPGCWDDPVPPCVYDAQSGEHALAEMV